MSANIMGAEKVLDVILNVARRYNKPYITIHLSTIRAHMGTYGGISRSTRSIQRYLKIAQESKFIEVEKKAPRGKDGKFHGSYLLVKLLPRFFTRFQSILKNLHRFFFPKKGTDTTKLSREKEIHSFRKDISQEINKPIEMIMYQGRLVPLKDVLAGRV